MSGLRYKLDKVASVGCTMYSRSEPLWLESRTSSMQQWGDAATRKAGKLRSNANLFRATNMTKTAKRVFRLV
jgi:hypothetical protein